MNIFKLTIIVFLFSAIVAITSCHSTDDASPTMPENARIINLANAKASYDEAISATDNILAKGAATTFAINDIFDQLREYRKNSGQDPVARATFDHNLSCAVGSAIETGDELSDGLGNGSGTGSINFQACEITNNIVLDGTVFFNYAWQDNGHWSNNLTGNITITQLDTNISIQLNELAISENGNDQSGNYVITIYQFAYDPGIGGFTVQIAKTVRGHDFSCAPSTGVIIINGSSGTRLRATYQGNRSLTIEVNINNGNYVEITGSPFLCTT